MKQDTHPLYQFYLNKWLLLRDSYDGEATIKSKGASYLPPTPGMQLDGMGYGQQGYLDYKAYLNRALYSGYVSEAIISNMGKMNKKPPVIELPTKLQYLLEKSNKAGEPLWMLLQRINLEQLLTGRCGLLLDLPENPNPANPEFYISLYFAEDVFNWDSDNAGKLNFVALSEAVNVRNGFAWEKKDFTRVLELRDGVYQQALFETDYNPDAMVTPAFRGATLDKIPFVFVNPKDNLSEPDTVPLEDLANLCLAIYRGEADYRQTLFLQGQDTLVVIGGIRNASLIPGEADAVRVGAGSRLDVDVGGDAKYIGVSAAGISEQRECLAADRLRAENKVGQLVGSSTQAESGDALKIRLGAQTATLTQVALAGANGLESLLKIAAEWVGANPDEVIVKPNLEFTDLAITAEELVKLMTARTMGAPLSNQTIHQLLVSHNMTSLDYETELTLIAEETANLEGQLFKVGKENA